MRVGDAAFFRILSTYAAQHRYGNTTTEDFIRTAEAVSGSGLGALFQSWLWEPKAPPMP